MNYSVISAELETNKQDILGIWKRNLSSFSDKEDFAQEKYAWYYQNNPYGPGQCWLLRDDRSGQFVGTAGLGLRNIKVLDQVVSAGLLVDFAVDQEHRSFLPACFLQEKVRRAVEENLDLIYSVPNSRATAVMLRAGYVRLGEMERYAAILNVKPYLRRAMGGIPGAGLLTAPLNLALRAASLHTLRVIPKEFVVREMDEFDSRFDALWERASRGFSVVAERTSLFLRWRYALFPLCRYHIFGLLDRDEKKLFGYVIYSLDQDSVTIADLFFEVSERILASLLSGFLRFASGKQVASISFSFMGSDKIRKTLSRFGFLRRGDQRAVVLFASRRSQSAGAALEQSNWYLAAGDQDNG